MSTTYFSRPYPEALFKILNNRRGVGTNASDWLLLSLYPCVPTACQPRYTYNEHLEHV